MPLLLNGSNSVTLHGLEACMDVAQLLLYKAVQQCHLFKSLGTPKALTQQQDFNLVQQGRAVCNSPRIEAGTE